MVDHEKKMLRLRNISVYIKFVLETSRSSRRSPLMAYIIIVIVKQRARNTKIVCYDDVDDKELIWKHRLICG